MDIKMKGLQYPNIKTKIKNKKVLQLPLAPKEKGTNALVQNFEMKFADVFVKSGVRTYNQ